MARAQKSWTPKEIRNKTAEKWQGTLYTIGAVSGLIAWSAFSQDNGEGGLKFALAAVVAFGLGSLIKTSWVKQGQVDLYVKDKKREALRWKFYWAGIVSGAFAFLALNSDSQDAGGFFAAVAVGTLLLGGILPVKWVKRGEISGYR